MRLTHHGVLPVSTTVELQHKKPVTSKARTARRWLFDYQSESDPID
jgi:hypothetical protein